MVSNVLMHREFTNSYTAKFVIEAERMYVENANRSLGDGFITEDNLEPIPKNPIIASFFRNIGYTDQLGSGVRNLFKYSKYYSGKIPKFIEGDIFRIIVPLDDSYSYDFGTVENKSADKVPIKNYEKDLSEQERLIVAYLKEYDKITTSKAEEVLGVKQRRARDILKELTEKGVLIKSGTYKSTVYVLNAEENG